MSFEHSASLVMHKVLQQRVLGVVGFLMIALLQIFY